MESELLIATNGYEGTWSAIEYGAWFAETLRLRVTLLGVSEKPDPAGIDDQHPLENIFARAVELFQSRGVEYTLEIENGDAVHLIPQRSNRGQFITVVSPLGRPQLRRWLTGRSFRSLMEQIQGPIVYVPRVRLPMKRLLLSAGGLGYEVAAENLAFQVAKAARAEVTILHVIPPTDLDYEATREVREHVEDLQDTDTFFGRRLRTALEVARAEGLNARVITRQGNVVEEILGEIRDGDYDLVSMGSAYSAHTLRQLYTPNVTAEVAEAANCPILTARHLPA